MYSPTFSEKMPALGGIGYAELPVAGLVSVANRLLRRQRHSSGDMTPRMGQHENPWRRLQKGVNTYQLPNLHLAACHSPAL